MKIFRLTDLVNFVQCLIVEELYSKFAEDSRAKSCKVTHLLLNIYSAPAADASLHPAHTDSRVRSVDVAHVRCELRNSKHGVRPEHDE